MPKTVSIEVFKFEELQDAPRCRAENTILSRLYDDEQYWYQEVADDFRRCIKPHGLYRHEELPASYWLNFDFNDSYQYHGARRGEYILKAFEEYLDRAWDQVSFDDDDISRYAEDRSMRFYPDGSIYDED